MVYKLSPVTIGIILKFIQAVNKNYCESNCHSIFSAIPKAVSVPTNRKPKTSNSAKNIILKASAGKKINKKQQIFGLKIYIIGSHQPFDHCEMPICIKSRVEKGYSQFLRFLPKRFK